MDDEAESRELGRRHIVGTLAVVVVLVGGLITVAVRTAGVEDPALPQWPRTQTGNPSASQQSTSPSASPSASPSPSPRRSPAGTPIAPPAPFPSWQTPSASPWPPLINHVGPS